MRTVIVIGAGASVCEAQHYHPKREKDKPPLDADFFERARLAGREPALIRRLEAHASSMGHTNPFHGPVPTSLERYLGLLFFGLLQSPTRADLSAYYSLLRLYTRELLATTNWLVGRKRGPLEAMVRTELGKDPESLAIVTFNHDLLAESALSSLPPRKFGRRWCLRHGYGFEDGQPRLLSRTTAEAWDPCDSWNHEHMVQVYKLHGSLNWLFTTRDLNPSFNLARQTKTIYLLPRRRPRADIQVRLSTRGRSFYGWPVVVPPVYEKQGFIKQHLQAVWDKARSTLLAADRVIFFGYSFPNADYHSRFFFERMSTENEALRKPIVINPDFHVAQACWDVLKAERVTVYRTFDEYCDAEEETLTSS